MKHGRTLAIMAFVLVIQVIEQVLFGVEMIEFYFGTPLYELRSLTLVMRVGMSLAPIGFVVVPLLIAAVYCELSDPQASSSLFAVSLSFFGHTLYVVIVIMLHFMIDLYVVSIAINIILILVLVHFLS